MQRSQNGLCCRCILHGQSHRLEERHFLSRPASLGSSQYEAAQIRANVIRVEQPLAYRHDQIAGLFKRRLAVIYEDARPSDCRPGNLAVGGVERTDGVDVQARR